MSSPTLVADTPPPPSASNDEKSNNELTFASWLGNLLLPSSARGKDKVVEAEKNKSSSSPDSMFFIIPGLAKVNLCCAETVTTSKDAEDRSNCSLDPQHGQKPDMPAKNKPAPSSSCQTWDEFLADINDAFCGDPFEVDGPPQTINIATPINRESSVTTADERLGAEESKAPEDSAVVAAPVVDETLEARDEPVVTDTSETIVVYYSDSGSVDDEKANDSEKPNEANDCPGPAPTVVRVALDPWDQAMDDAILQERARAEATEAKKTSDASLANSESGPVRFHNLATGSFCEVSVDEDDAANNEEGLLRKTVSRDLPLVEEEDIEGETASEPETIQEEGAEDPKVTGSDLGGEQEADAAADSDEKEVKEGLLLDDKAEDLKQQTLEENAGAGEPQAEVVEIKSVETEALDTDTKKCTMPIEPSHTESVDEGPQGQSEAPPAVSEPTDSLDTTSDVEASETTVKMVSLFVGVFEATAP